MTQASEGIVRQWLPACVTLMVVAFGLSGFEAARVGQWDLAFGLIVLAAIADGLDGRVARALHVAGPLGAQLDSLSDVVTFGAAPAFLFATRFADAPPVLRFAVALGFVAAGAFRLARYNVEDRHEGFTGMPITCAGVLLAAAVAQPFVSGVVSTGVVAVILGMLMVSEIPFVKITSWRWEFTPFAVAAVIPLVLAPTAETLATVTLALFGAYVVWNVISLLDHRGHAVGEDATLRP